MGSYLAIWGLMSFVMFIGTFRLNKALQVTFFLLVVAFALLSIGDFIGNPLLKQDRRLRGHGARLLGHVHRPRPDPERALRPGRLAARTGRQVTASHHR